MGVARIEGTITEVKQGRSPPFGNATIYKRVVWDTAEGEETLKNFVVDRSMNDFLEPGATGSFYRYTAVDQKGVFGYRGAGGAAHYAWPSNARYMGTIMVTVGFLLVLTNLILRSAIAFLGVILLAFGILVLVLDGQNRTAGQELFDADGGG